MVSTVPAEGAWGKPLGGIPNGLLGVLPKTFALGGIPGMPGIPEKGDAALCKAEQEKISNLGIDRGR